MPRSDTFAHFPRKLAALVGSGDRIMLFTAPFLVAGLVLQVLVPSLLEIGGPPLARGVLAAVLGVPGVVLWIWSVILVVTRIPRGELITHGPYALCKHPLYTSVALLVLPAIGLLADTWLGVALGAVLYVASRIFSPAEERELERTFGAAYDRYRAGVKLPWL